MRALALHLLLATSLLAPATAEAGRRDDRPWGRGVLLPSIGAGASFSSYLSTVSLGLGASYFVANGLAFGLSVSDTVFIYSRGLRTEYPGIADQVATNMVRVMPTLQYVFWRGHRFAPYVFGGVGPVFFNHGGGTVGEWTAGPGAFIGLGGPVYLDLGIGFSARFPIEKCNDAFYYDGPNAAGQVIDACSFRWGPRIGFVLAFGGGRRRAAPEPPPEPHDQPAPRTWEEPPPAAVAEPTPAEPPVTDAPAPPPADAVGEAEAEPTGESVPLPPPA